MTGLELTLANLAVAIGAMFQGAVGMGLGLLAAPALVLLDPTWVPAPLLSAALVLNVLLLMRERAGIDVRGLRWALPGQVVGVAAGAAALTVIQGDAFAILFGTMVVAAVAVSLVASRVVRTRTVLLAAGLISGFMGTTISIGGPPMALLYQHEEGSRVRGTLASYFTVAVMTALVGLWLAGRLSGADVVRAASVMPGLLVGFVVSRPLRRLVDRGFVRPAILAVAVVSATVILIRALA